MGFFIHHVIQLGELEVGHGVLLGNSGLVGVTKGGGRSLKVSKMVLCNLRMVA